MSVEGSTVRTSDLVKVRDLTLAKRDGNSNEIDEVID
jgi:hypothetical protein